MKKALKICSIAIGAFAGIGVLGLAYIGAGNIFIEQYHDPEHWQETVCQSARYGWSLKTNDGWAA